MVVSPADFPAAEFDLWIVEWKVYLRVEKEYDILPFVVLETDLTDLTINNCCIAVTSSAWHSAHNSVSDMTSTTSDASEMRPPPVGGYDNDK